MPAADLPTTDALPHQSQEAPPGPSSESLDRTAGTVAPATGAAAQAGAAAPSAVTDIPGLSIQLPAGYDLARLNAAKKSVPLDPDTEPLPLATIVDPADAGNNLTDVPLEEIKGRGNFTWTLAKKPYQIKFASRTSVLGMPSAKTWILLANHADPSLLRNKTAYDLALEFGLEATPETRFVDLTINGEYLGNYLLTEKVEVKANRLDLQDPGGILLELDNGYGRDETHHFVTARSRSIFVLKDAVGGVDDTLAPATAAAYTDIQKYLGTLESLLYAPDPDWPRIAALIDEESFLKYYFVAEAAANSDVTLSSVYFYRDGPGDELHAGPVWDFDIAFGNATSERLGGNPTQDYVKNGQMLRGGGNDWFTQLFRNEEFAVLANQTYDNELKGALDALPSRIDGYAASIRQSAEANFRRWSVLGRPSLIPDGHTPATTYAGEVSALRSWVATRAAHLAAVHTADAPILTYASHAANVGWQPRLTGGQIAGTVGSGLQLESLDVKLLGSAIGGSLQSNAHVQNVGWSGWRDGDARLGTTGRGLQLEGLRFRLGGRLAERFDISYRAHVQNVGWMNWVTNGTLAGTTGRGLQIEAVQLRLVDRNDTTPPPQDDPGVTYGAHVSTVGWMADVQARGVAGTTGRALPVEAFRASVDSRYSGSIRYRGHVQGIGWMDWTDSSSGFIGTVGRGLRLEALEVTLTGELASHYTVRYSGHVEGIGWQGWVSDGTTAGTTGRGLRLEAVALELVPKAG